LMRTVDAVSVDFSGNASDKALMKMGADPLQAYLVVTD
jgi:hypothetical protein